MGASAGGTPQTAGTAQQASDVALAPRTPYSQELATTTPSTSLAIGNTPFDPYAEQAAQLAAMRAQTAALQSQITGGGTTGTAAAPAAAAATPTWPTNFASGTPESAASPYMVERDPVTGAYRAKAWDQDVRGLIDVNAQSLASDAALRRTMEWAMGPKVYGAVPGKTGQYANEVANLFQQAGVSPTGNFTGYTRPVGASSATGLAQGGPRLETMGARAKPVNPGPRVPWQASAQYWKDLEAYRRGQ